MSFTVTYENERGALTMSGKNEGDLKITAIEGLGPIEKEYMAAVYTGYPGQETISKRAVSRTITLAVEISGKNAQRTISKTLDILNKDGTMLLKNQDMERIIYCNQVQVYDVKRVLDGQLYTFLIQFVCDNPYFEDKTVTDIPLYRRAKLLKPPFTLPCAFGEILFNNTAKVEGSIDIEPIITLYYPEAIQSEEYIIIMNETTGKMLKLSYAPKADDTVVIDVKNRKITSTVSGNLINCLSDDSFLGDFVLVRGVNNLAVNLGDITAGFVCGCQYRNSYHEAVMV